MEREDVHIIARHSNWTKKSIENILKKEFYNDKESWVKFLRLFFVSLGVGFTAIGIVFFFAYNWENLHKFVKIGIVESLIILTILIVLFSKISLDIKKIVLTGASILVGVLFAVFGQIYQTGANAYDFFLGWTMFVSIWVLVSSFAPLWLVFIVLINTTFILYSQQVAHDWSDIFVLTLLAGINLLFLSIALFGNKISAEIKFPIWFSNLLALAVVFFSTVGIVIGIFDQSEVSFVVLLILVFVLYVLGIIFGLRERRIFYLSIIPFSIIVIITSLFIKVLDDIEMFLFISLFVVGSITFVIKNLIDLQRKWIN